MLFRTALPYRCRMIFLRLFGMRLYLFTWETHRDKMSDFSNTAKNLDSGFRLFFSAIQSHEYVGAEKPFRRNDAWQWMIFEACGSRNGREIARNLHGSVKPIFEPYGSLTHSIRFMAEAFGWTEKKVRTFLKNLQNLKMIDVKTTHSINQISICNFDIYQNPSREKGHTAGTNSNR